MSVIAMPDNKLVIKVVGIDMTLNFCTLLFGDLLNILPRCQLNHPDMF